MRNIIAHRFMWRISFVGALALGLLLYSTVFAASTSLESAKTTLAAAKTTTNDARNTLKSLEEAKAVSGTITDAHSAVNSAESTEAAAAKVVSDIELEKPEVTPPPPSGFVGSVDTMKLSKDQAGGGFTSADAQAVDLAASMATTHITDNVPLQYPSTMLAWANRIHADGKHVWFRLASTNGANEPHGDLGDGYPEYKTGYLTKFHEIMRANPSMFKSGDILDADAEAENSSWWKNHYGCGVQSCSTAAAAFNVFLQKMTQQENVDLAAMGITGVNTNVHSTDPGTGTNQLTKETVEKMGNLITVDAYPDQSTESPSTAAANWKSNLENWHKAWENKGLKVSILVGEWGYSNTINVSDSTQASVIKAEVETFPTVPYLIGMNYWVGPGSAGDGGYTQIFTHASGSWQFRPAAPIVSNFYAGETK